MLPSAATRAQRSRSRRMRAAKSAPTSGMATSPRIQHRAGGGVGHRRGEHAAHGLHQAGVHPGGADQAEPVGHVQRREVARQQRQVGRHGGGLRRGQRQAPHLPGAHQLHHLGDVGEHQVDAPGRHVQHRRRPAAIGDVDQAQGARLMREMLRRELVGGAVARAGIGQRAGIGLGARHQRGEVAVRPVARHDQRHGRAREVADRRQLPVQIQRDLRAGDGGRDAHHPHDGGGQGQPVRRRAGGRLGGEEAERPGARFRDDRRPAAPGDGVGGDAHRLVHRAAGREAHQHADRPAGLGQGGGGQQREGEDGAAVHGASPARKGSVGRPRGAARQATGASRRSAAASSPGRAKPKRSRSVLPS